MAVLLLAGALLLAGSGCLPSSPAPAATATVRYVATSGSDAAAGTKARPWRSLQYALSRLQPGETLYVRGGTFVENVHISASRMHAGTPSEPVKVIAYPGERPVVKGLLWLTNASWWHLHGINVTWNPTNTSGSHMVKLLGGTGWRFSNGELWGARSYAALLVGTGARAFKVDHNFIHDTYASNDTNQDHLIYVDNGPGGSGVIEKNVLARSPNGRGVKLGPGSLDRPGTSNIVVRYNTFYDNRGPSNIQLSGSSSDNQLYRNLLVRSSAGATNITAWNLTGTNNVVRDNIGWASSGVAAFTSSLINGGGNRYANPGLADPTHNNFIPSSSASAYGALVGG